jgi:hypothetical protein
MMVKRYGPKGSKMMENNVKGPEARSNKELAEGEATQIKVTKEGKKENRKEKRKKKEKHERKRENMEKGMCVWINREKKTRREELDVFN